MNIPRPGDNYDRRTEEERNRVLEQADNLNYKKNQDVRIIDPVRLILQSPDGTEWSIEIDNTGTIVPTSL